MLEEAYLTEPVCCADTPRKGARQSKALGLWPSFVRGRGPGHGNYMEAQVNTYNREKH